MVSLAYESPTLSASLLRMIIVCFALLLSFPFLWWEEAWEGYSLVFAVASVRHM